MAVSNAFVLRKGCTFQDVEVLYSLSSSLHTALPTAEQVSLFAFDAEFQCGEQILRAFVLTQESGSRMYGSALTQVFETKSETSETSANNEAITVTSALSLVILSEIPAFDAMKTLLYDLFPYQSSQSVPNPADIIARVTTTIPVIPYPLPGSAVKVTIQSSISKSPVSTIFSLPSLREHPSNKCSDDDVNLLFRVLPPVAILAAVRALLLEQRIVIHVADGPLESILAPICEALLSLLYPLHTWPHAYAPLLPSGALLEEILQSPVPVFIGSGSKAFALLDPSSLEGVVEVNLNDRTVVIPGEGAYGIGPPSSIAQSWFGSPTVGFRSSATKNQTKIPSLPLRMQKSLIEAISRASSQTHVTSTADLLSLVSVDRTSGEHNITKVLKDVRIKHECQNWEHRKPAETTTFCRSLIQRAFLDAMLLLVGDYDEHMQEIPNVTSARNDEDVNFDSKSTAASAAAYLGLHFDRVSALACKREYEPFVSALYGTQLFDDFLSQRLRVSAWTDPSVLFFDALVDTVVTGVTSPFLQGIAVTGERAFIERTKPMLSVIISGDASYSYSDERIQKFTPNNFETTFLEALEKGSASDDAKPLLPDSKIPESCISSPGLQGQDDSADIPLGGGCFASPKETSASDAVVKVVKNRMSIAGDQIKRERLRSKRISNIHELRITLSPAEKIAPPPPPPPSAPPPPPHPLPSLSTSRFGLSTWAFKSKAVIQSTQDIPVTNAPALPPLIPAFDALRSPLPASHITAELASPIVNGQSIRKRRRMLHDTSHPLPPAPPPPHPLPNSLSNVPMESSSTPQKDGTVENSDTSLHILHFNNFVSEAPTLVHDAPVDILQNGSEIKTPKTSYIAQLEQRVACLEQALEIANETIRNLRESSNQEDVNNENESQSEHRPSKRTRV
jgi:hypothetical protein